MDINKEMRYFKCVIYLGLVLFFTLPSFSDVSKEDEKTEAQLPKDQHHCCNREIKGGSHQDPSFEHYLGETAFSSDSSTEGKSGGSK